MLFALKVIIIYGFAGLLKVYRKPIVLAGVYAGLSVLFVVLKSYEFEPLAAIVGGGIVFGLAFAYFWLLLRYEDAPMIYWSIFVVGILFGMV